MHNDIDQLTSSAVELLQQLIATPSVSRSEAEASALLCQWLENHGANPMQEGCNIYAMAKPYDAAKPTLMLNSHIDTVAPSASYTRDPYTPALEGDSLYGLGSNDAGASLVSLCHAFLHLSQKGLNFNLLLAASAEEEVSGINGMRRLLPHLLSKGINIDMGIVGEPTGMNPAIGERGLVVLDGEAHGKAGHAARNEGINALYIALDDINTLRNFVFPKCSPTLGTIKVTTTMIECGKAHNVIPDTCRYVVDIRTTDAYTNEETVRLLQSQVKSTLQPRSTHLRASAIDTHHPLVQAAMACGGTPFVSPTMSDQALLPFPTLKIGPGESSRSHTADEYVLVSEIRQGISTYINLIQHLST